MDCATLCFISATLAFTPSSDVQKCFYCLDVRGITQTCNEDIMECVKTYPDMVLYCLTVNSLHFDTQISRAIRCRSHAASNASLFWTEEVMGLEDCSFSTSKVCNCSTCPLREETRIPQILQNPINRHEQNYQNSFSNNGNKHEAFPNLLHTPANQNKTYLLTKGMAENIRRTKYVYNNASFLYFQFSFFIFIFFCVQ